MRASLRLEFREAQRLVGDAASTGELVARGRDEGAQSPVPSGRSTSKKLAGMFYQGIIYFLFDHRSS